MWAGEPARVMFRGVVYDPATDVEPVAPLGALVLPTDGQVRVIKNFDERDVVGTGRVWIEAGRVWVEFEGELEAGGCRVPAIGMVQGIRREGGVPLVTQAHIHCVSLGEGNVDPTIGPLEEVLDGVWD